MALEGAAWLRNSLIYGCVLPLEDFEKCQHHQLLILDTHSINEKTAWMPYYRSDILTTCAADMHMERMVLKHFQISTFCSVLECTT